MCGLEEVQGLLLLGQFGRLEDLGWAHRDEVHPKGTQTMVFAWCLQPWRVPSSCLKHFDRYFKANLNFLSI